MARSFNGAGGSDGEYLRVDNPPFTAYPFTLAGWFYAAATNVTYDLIFLKTNGSNYAGIYLNPSGSSPVIGATIDDNVTAVSSATYTANTWNHAAGVFTSATSRQAFLNGAGGSVLTTNRTFSIPIQVHIGGFLDGTNVWGNMNGRIAEIGCWNAALTAAEVNALAKGASPLKIRPGNLQAYYPILGNGTIEPNFSINTGAAYNLDVYGSVVPPQAPHPPVMRPFGGQRSGLIFPPAAPAGRVKIWNGSAWVLKPVKIWTGSAWIEKPAKIWNGSAWV